MFHHYMQRGHALSSLMQLSEADRAFYMASMELEIETINKTFGGGDNNG